MKKLIISVKGVVFALLAVCFWGCASSKPVDLRAANELSRLGVLNSIADNGGFLFFVSKDVTLTRTRNSLDSNAKGTAVKRQIAKDIVHLYRDTSGRIQGGSPNAGLEIGFEKLSDGSIPTIKFVLKEGSANKYYFAYESDGTVKYGDDYYNISFSGVEQPFLLYKQVVKTSEKTRKIKGLK